MYRMKRIFSPDEIRHLIKENDLMMPDNSDYTIGLFDGKKLVATGSLGNDIIKCLAVDSAYKSEGIIGIIVSELINIAAEKNIFHLFLYTKPENSEKFLSLGFEKVGAGGNEVVLFERGKPGIEEYKKGLRAKKNNDAKSAGAVVMNMNPLTNGHLYLIEKARQLCDWLYIFVVEEDRSYFPFEVRMELIKSEMQDKEGITIMPSGKYIISSATFPSYFLKEEDVERARVSLDVDIFVSHIAPTLNIKKRIVGNEPFCKVTAQYNACMKKVLPQHGIEFIEIDRLTKDGVCISASYVREMIKGKEYEKIKGCVPSSTYEYITSGKGKEIFNKEFRR